MKKYKIIIDTDPGVDDATALCFALNDPQFDIKLISVSGGNIKIDQAIRNVCHILDLLDKDVPVVKGYENRLGTSTEYAYHIHGEEGLGNYIPPKTTKHKPIKKDCADAMYEVLKESPNEVIFVVLGPHTNLANLLKKYPDSKNLIKKVVMMGGAPGGIKIDPNYKSFNIRTDVEAFEETLKANLDITLCSSKMGRDVTYFSEEQVNFIKNSSDFGKFLALTYETYFEPGYDPKILSTCDLTALYFLLYPRLYKTKKAFVEVDTKEYPGKITAIYNRKGNFSIIENVNRKKFQKYIFAKFKEFEKLKIENKTFLKNIKKST